MIVQRGIKPLYTWVNEQVLVNQGTLISSLSVCSEDGVKREMRIYNLYDKDEIHFKTEQVLDVIKQARPHYRLLFIIQRNYMGGSAFVLARMNDKVYTHPKYGEKTKQMIQVNEISEDLIDIYQKHFEITAKVKALTDRGIKQPSSYQDIFDIEDNVKEALTDLPLVGLPNYRISKNNDGGYLCKIYNKPDRIVFLI